SCGRSKNQPFCDGSHKETGFTPMKIELTETEKVWLCGCKRSGDKPFCDGAHKKLL
ncbi:MAG TPA: CDGSH iron-sulfur domain-containing protein, partial [Chromatiaceae bacterium]|nr:CDGSH iron-sulfur domain-containing protein [Chromatiaceae bacterium]